MAKLFVKKGERDSTATFAPTLLRRLRSIKAKATPTKRMNTDTATPEIAPSLELVFSIFEVVADPIEIRISADMGETLQFHIPM